MKKVMTFQDGEKTFMTFAPESHDFENHTHDTFMTMMNSPEKKIS